MEHLFLIGNLSCRELVCWNSNPPPIEVIKASAVFMDANPYDLTRSFAALNESHLLNLSIASVQVELIFDS